MTEWYQRWFGEEYLRLYPHRNEEDARQAIDLIAGRVPIGGRRVLDLACGPGRHAAELARRSARVTGLDLSMALLRRARELRTPVTGLVRGDIRRLPFRPGSFDVVVNLFTSFGYFADDEQHAQVLEDVKNVLRPQGTFVLDYFHSDSIRRGLVAEESVTRDGERVEVRRSISPDNRYVIKDMRLTNQSFQERVRLFSPDELERLLADTGFRITSRFGAYDGRPLTGDAPRAIFIAHRS